MVDVTRGRLDRRSQSDQVVWRKLCSDNRISSRKRAAFTVCLFSVCVGVCSARVVCYLSSDNKSYVYFRNKQSFINSRGSKTLEGTKRTYMIFLRLKMQRSVTSQWNLYFCVKFIIIWRLKNLLDVSSGLSELWWTDDWILYIKQP